MKTREQIITDMCYTWRHDYGIERTSNSGFTDALSAGMTKSEREFLWQQMAQVYDNCIAPVMQPRRGSVSHWERYTWTDWSEP